MIIESAKEIMFILRILSAEENTAEGQDAALPGEAGVPMDCAAQLPRFYAG
jgi:hypothetical protein